MTQQELTRRMGRSLSTLFKIESDERRPSYQMAELLAKHLEIPSDQQALFLKVARKEKATDTLGGLPGVEQPTLFSTNLKDSLLATKLYIPPARLNRVPRPRLIEQLNILRPLTLISAPA